MVVPINSGSHFQKRKVDIIWNLTLICPWDCEVCCVDAVQVIRNNGDILIKSNGLTQITKIPNNKSLSIYDQASEYRQKIGEELTFNQKLQVLNNLDGFDVKIDFSGGDVLTVAENFQVLKVASQKFGKNQITLTATGAGLAKMNVEEVATFIGEMNFTYDGTDFEGGKNRPNGYAIGNLKKASEFKKNGVKTRAECPLTVQNVNEENLRKIYLNLHKNNIDKLLIMRLFPVGRGSSKHTEIPTPNQYRQAIDFLRDMEKQYGFPQLKLQCAMKHFDNSELTENPCDLFTESFGLTPNGILLTSPWAINTVGKPLDEAWILGNLTENSLSEILNSEKAKIYQHRRDQNFGHCKIFSFFNSEKTNAIDRIFDRTDPLYL